MGGDISQVAGVINSQSSVALDPLRRVSQTNNKGIAIFNCMVMSGLSGSYVLRASSGEALSPDSTIMQVVNPITAIDITSINNTIPIMADFNGMLPVVIRIPIDAYLNVSTSPLTQLNGSTIELSFQSYKSNQGDIALKDVYENH